MRKVVGSRYSLAAIALLAGVPACSSSSDPPSPSGQAGSAPSAQGGSTPSAQGGSAGTAPGGSAGSVQGGSAGAVQGGSDGGCTPLTLNGSTVLIDDMETTDHGPHQLTAGISAPLSPGYWYNSGANYAPSGGAGGAGAVIDTSDPPQGSFKFSALPEPSKTLDCMKISEHAAHQSCVLHGLYDTCGVGFEFAQQPDTSAGGAGGGGGAGGTSAAGSDAGGSAGAGGASAGGSSGGTAGGSGAGSGGENAGGSAGSKGGAGSAGTAGEGGSSAGGAGAAGTAGAGGVGAGGADAGGTAGTGGVSAGGADAGGSGGTGGSGPPIPMTTVPFDISRYKAVTFWGMTTTPNPETGSMRVKVQFPDTDTDPRGKVCNGGGPNTSKCYNSYAAYVEFTTRWQQFTVLLDPGVDKMPPPGGISIDPTWGYQQAQWLPNAVYGISWQAQKDTEPDAGPPLMTDLWIDDVYFVE